jgi:hypothetical protein
MIGGMPHHTPSSPDRFFDTRSAYRMFVTATDEKAVTADRLSEQTRDIQPGPNALRVFDAGMGDGLILSRLMRRLHQQFEHIPWLIVAKETSVEDVRQALSTLPDRFHEHPEMVVVITNLLYREAPTLSSSTEVVWRSLALEGSSGADFDDEIRALFPQIAEDWRVQAHPQTGNPVYVQPTVLVMYRKDREFILKAVIPSAGEVEGVYDFMIASQPYRARTSAERRVKLVIAPLARALAPGGKLVAVHSAGDDPPLEIVRNVWPGENPFGVDRTAIVEAARRMIDDPALVFDPLVDEEAIFRFWLHTMPAGDHIGTPLILAAWNAATYVSQIDGTRLDAAMASGEYVKATQDVLAEHDGIWFNDEMYIVRRRR